MCEFFIMLYKNSVPLETRGLVLIRFALKTSTRGEDWRVLEQDTLWGEIFPLSSISLSLSSLNCVVMPDKNTLGRQPPEKRLISKLYANKGEMGMKKGSGER